MTRPQLIMPAWLYAHWAKTRPPVTCWAPEVRDDRMYLIDQQGNVHYFEYMGKNLAAESDDVFGDLLEATTEKEQPTTPEK